MAFRVRISARAKRDLKDILNWLTREGAGETGLRWWQGLQEQVLSLAENPQRCSLAPENEFTEDEIRHLLYGRRSHVYRIVFSIQEDVVLVLFIRHGRRLSDR